VTSAITRVILLSPLRVY